MPAPAVWDGIAGEVSLEEGVDRLAGNGRGRVRERIASKRARFIRSDQFVDEEERIAVRQQFDSGQVEFVLELRKLHGSQPSAFLNTSTPLWPPKPSDVDMATRMSRALPTFGV